jgi:cytoplasmic iron level regulating protein YaaA (DUF328/UPF0246 family)
MARVILISCVKSKRRESAKVRDLYVSTWFRLALRYAQQQDPDSIFVLSALHGLLGLDQKIAPYEKTLKTMKNPEVLEWAQQVLEQLGTKFNLAQDHFVVLASEKYRKYILPHLASFEVPMEGLRSGMQLQFLKRHVGP